MMTTLAHRVAALAAFTIVATASAQLTTERLYNGIGRSIDAHVKVPDGATGAASVALLAAASGDELARAPVDPGDVDLAALFPGLWTEANPRVRYAQLMVGDKAVGPAVVIQPMLSPTYAAQVDGSRPPNPVWGPNPRPTFSGVRTYVDKYVELNTSHGKIVIRLRPDKAPNTAFNFRSLAEGGYYTDIIFHRILESFVIQVGDPTGSGTGGPGYFVDLENSDLHHDFGVLSMARSGDPNSNGSQVFIALTRQRTAGLDGKYTAFGETIAGADTITSIASVKVDEAGRPVSDPPVLESARLVDADPYPDQPAAAKAPSGER